MNLKYFVVTFFAALSYYIYSQDICTTRNTITNYDTSFTKLNYNTH